MPDNITRPRYARIDEIVQRPAFGVGLLDGARGAPWRQHEDPRDQLTYERGRHLVAAWRSLGRPSRPVFEGKRIAPWVADAFCELRRMGAVL